MKAKHFAITKFTVAAIILGLMGYWMVMTTRPLHGMAYGIIGAMLIVVAVIIYSGIKALKDSRSDLEPIDELSKRINQKAAATSFSISIYMWLAGMFLIDLVPVDSVNKAKLVIAVGMLAMTLLFLLLRFYFTRTGIDDH